MAAKIPRSHPCNRGVILRWIGSSYGLDERALSVVEQEFGIEIKGDSAHFVASVRGELEKILRSRAGRALAASLHYHRTQMSSQPVLLMPYEGDDCNAEEDAVVAGSSQSVVLFSPTGGSRCSDGNAATLPHEVLFHELVHALRRVSGKLHRYRLTGQLRQYGNSEEFLAILVTNIFISDVTNHHKTLLRRGWVGHTPLDPEHAESYRFFSYGTRAFNIIAGFCSDNSGFARMLATVPARFNPIAAYYKNAHQAFEAAAKGDSEDVFDDLTPFDYFQRGDGAWARITPYKGP
jgi:hypothetical protein